MREQGVETLVECVGEVVIVDNNVGIVEEWGNSESGEGAIGVDVLRHGGDPVWGVGVWVALETVPLLILPE